MKKNTRVTQTMHDAKMRALALKETATNVEHAAEHVARRFLVGTRGLTIRRVPVLRSSQVVIDTTVDMIQLSALQNEIERQSERASRAEDAAGRLRADLRAAQLSLQSSSLDVHGLARDLAQEIAKVHVPEVDKIERIIYRVFGWHGMATSVDKPTAAHSRSRKVAMREAVTLRQQEPKRVIVGWTTEQQEYVAKNALARTPDISKDFYVYQALAVVARLGRGTLADLTKNADIESGIAQRRLRLAIETLTAMGVLQNRDGVITLLSTPASI